MNPFIPTITGTTMILIILGGHYNWDLLISITGIEQQTIKIQGGILA